MPDVLVRGLDRQTVARLKARAKRNGRSLQSEARLLLEQAAGAENLSDVFDQLNRRFKGRRFGSAASLIRADRQR